MLEKVKSLWAQWKVQISVVGGVLVVATAYGSCTFEPPVAEEPAVEEAAATDDATPAAVETAGSTTTGSIISSFTVFAEDQLMLVTDAGKVIRIRVDGGEGDVIRIAGRKTQGVRLFEIDDAEKVVSVGMIRDTEADEEDDESIST